MRGIDAVKVGLLDCVNSSVGKAMSAETDFVCTQCHTRQLIGPSVGSPFLGLIALIFGVLAFVFLPMPINILAAGVCGGVMAYAGRTAVHQCRACGASALIPVSSPVGRQIVGAPIVMAPLDQDGELRHFGVTRDGDSFLWGGQRFNSPEAALLFAKSRG